MKIFATLIIILSALTSCVEYKYVYVDRPVNVYPVLPEPIEPIKSKIENLDLLKSPSGMTTFDISPEDKFNISIATAFKTYGVHNAGGNVVVWLDAEQYAELSAKYSILMSNYILMLKFLNVYSLTYKKLEDKKAKDLEGKKKAE